MRQKIVLKLGGSSLQDPGTLQELIALVRGYRETNYDVIIVHGGGPSINQELTSRGIQWKFINGQRQTTLEMMDVIEGVLSDKINSMLVTALRAANIPAVGISGAQEKMLLCIQASAELMQVGQVESVNTAIIEKNLQFDLNFTPVIAPIGIGEQNEKYNINADWAAAKIAIALQAEKLIFLTDQNGVLGAHKQLLHHATPPLLHQLIEEGVISGGMYTKVMTMMTALQAGVQQIRVLNANVASHLLRNHNVGTLLVDDQFKVKKEVLEWTLQLN